MAPQIKKTLLKSLLTLLIFMAWFQGFFALAGFSLDHHLKNILQKNLPKASQSLKWESLSFSGLGAVQIEGLHLGSGDSAAAFPFKLDISTRFKLIPILFNKLVVKSISLNKIEYLTDHPGNLSELLPLLSLIPGLFESYGTILNKSDFSLTIARGALDLNGLILGDMNLHCKPCLSQNLKIEVRSGVLLDYKSLEIKHLKGSVHLLGDSLKTDSLRGRIQGAPFVIGFNSINSKEISGVLHYNKIPIQSLSSLVFDSLAQVSGDLSGELEFQIPVKNPVSAKGTGELVLENLSMHQVSFQRQSWFKSNAPGFDTLAFNHLKMKKITLNEAKIKIGELSGLAPGFLVKGTGQVTLEQKINFDLQGTFSEAKLSALPPLSRTALEARDSSGNRIGVFQVHLRGSLQNNHITPASSVYSRAAGNQLSKIGSKFRGLFK
jgi:hypothetical protein